MTVAELQLLGAAALIFTPLERFLPLHREQRTLRPGLTLDALHMFVSGFLIRVGTAVTTLGFAYACGWIVPAGYHDAIRNQPAWLQFVQLFVLSDLCFYFAHRLVHAVPALWRFHAVHHSSEQMDWLSTFRVHPVDQILNSTIIAAPAIVLGISPGPLLVYASLYRLHAMLLHSNVALTFGPLARIVATPRYHHWHHANEPQAYDRNFGGQLVIWDRLFRTLYESPTLPGRYGAGRTVPARYVQQLVTPFLRRRRRSSR